MTILTVILYSRRYIIIIPNLIRIFMYSTYLLNTKKCSERQCPLKRHSSLQRLTFSRIVPSKVPFEISPFLSNVNDTLHNTANSDDTYELEIERNQSSRFKNLFVNRQISRSYESARILVNPMITALQLTNVINMTFASTYYYH